MPEEKEDNESRRSSLAFPQDNQPRRSEEAREDIGALGPRDSVQSELSHQIEAHNRLAAAAQRRSRSRSPTEKEGAELEGGCPLADNESDTQSSEAENGFDVEGGGTAEGEQPNLEQIQEDRFMVRQGSPKYNISSEDQELQKPLVEAEAVPATKRTTDP